MAQYGNHWGGPPSHHPGYAPPQNGVGGPPSHSFTAPPQGAPPPGIPLGAPPPPHFQQQHQQQQHVQFPPPPPGHPGVQSSVIGPPPPQGGVASHIGHGQFGGSVGGYLPPGQHVPPPVTVQQMQQAPWAAPPTSVSQSAIGPPTSMPPPNMPFTTGPPHPGAPPYQGAPPSMQGHQQQQQQHQHQDVWIEIKTADGQSCYYNSRTQQNTWTRPEGAKIEPLTITSQQQTPPAASNLPPPQVQQINPNDDIWAVTKAADGRIYFYNAKTRETSWTQPMGPNVRILTQEEVEAHKQVSAQRSNDNDKKTAVGNSKGASRWSMPQEQTMQKEQTLQKQDKAKQEIKDESLCMVCREPYSEEFPKVSLPKCGHCMCRPCLTKLLNSESPKCPECRKPYNQYKFNIDLKDLPADFHLTSDAESTYTCDKHSETSTHYCKDCKIQVCVECTLEGDHKKCDLVKNSVIRVQKTMMKEHATQMILNLDSSKEKQLKQFDSIVVSLLRNAFINTNLDQHLNTARNVVEDLEELKDCSEVLARKETMDTIQRWYCKSFPENKESLILADDSMSNSESEQLKGDTVNIDGESLTNEDGTSNSKEDSTRKDNASNLKEDSTKKGILKDHHNKREDTDCKTSSQDNPNKRSILDDPFKDDKENKRRKSDGTTSTSAINNTNPYNYIFNSLVLKCGVYHSDGRWARVTCEEKGVHLYTLRSDEEESRSDCALMMQYDPLRNSIPESSTLTFLDIGIRGVKKARLYVRMFGQTARGQQFTWFCSGEKGPSYRNLKFKRHHNKNKAGEWIATDDYGGEQSPPLVEGLTYGGEVSHPVEAGTVTGFFKSARFGVYLEANPKQSTALSFGKVEIGLKAIKTALRNEKIEDVTVLDCGLVLPK